MTIAMRISITTRSRSIAGEAITTAIIPIVVAITITIKIAALIAITIALTTSTATGWRSIEICTHH